MIYIVHIDLLEGMNHFTELTDEEVINLCKNDKSGRHIICEDLKQLELIWNGEDINDMFHPEDSYIRIIDEPQEYFPVSQVSREDLKWKGFDTSNVTDEQMRRIASLMDNTFLDGDYWLALEAAAEHLDIPKMPTDKNGDPIEVGTKVRWYDPDKSARDLTRVWEVFKIDEDIIHIKEIGSSSEAEAFAEELEIVE